MGRRIPLLLVLILGFSFFAAGLRNWIFSVQLQHICDAQSTTRIVYVYRQSASLGCLCNRTVFKIFFLRKYEIEFNGL